MFDILICIIVIILLFYFYLKYLSQYNMTISNNIILLKKKNICEPFDLNDTTLKLLDTPPDNISNKHKIKDIDKFYKTKDITANDVSFSKIDNNVKIIASTAQNNFAEALSNTIGNIPKDKNIIIEKPYYSNNGNDSENENFKNNMIISKKCCMKKWDSTFKLNNEYIRSNMTAKDACVCFKQ